MKYCISINIPYYLKKILQILELNNFEAFIVGGCIRDSILGLDPKDWDIATNATPSDLTAIFQTYNIKKHFTILPLAPQHGTLGIKPKRSKSVYEITTYRIDGQYSDSRRPDSITFTQDIALDLARRDFSVNAMACCLVHFTSCKDRQSFNYMLLHYKVSMLTPITHILRKYIMYHNIPNITLQDIAQPHMTSDSNRTSSHCVCVMWLYDPFHGIRDLTLRRIVCVGNATLRFQEDALRIMRALRFLAKLPQCFSLETHTRVALCIFAPALTNIAKERILIEFHKLLLGDYASQVLSLYRHIIMLPFSMLHVLFMKQFSLNCKALQHAPKNLVLRLAILYNPFPYNTRHWYDNNYKALQYYYSRIPIHLKELRYDKKTIKYVTTILCMPIITWHNAISLKKMLYKYGKEYVAQWLTMYNTIQSTLESKTKLFYPHTYIATLHSRINIKSAYFVDIGFIQLDYMALKIHACYRTPAPFSLRKHIQYLLSLYDTIMLYNECYSIAQLPINGTDIRNIAKHIGVKIVGRDIGNILHHILILVIYGKCQCQRETLLHIAKDLLYSKLDLS